MKKLLIMISALIMTVTTSIGLAACDLFGGGNSGEGTGNGSQTGTPGGNGGQTETPGGNGGTSHTHSYVIAIEQPTESKTGKVTEKCSCGDAKPDIILPVLTSGQYGKTSDTATCNKGGMVEYNIKIDGATYKFQVLTPATGKHIYVDGTCICGAKEPVDPNGVKSVEIRHELGNGKYLWNEQDVIAGRYSFYGAQLIVTMNSGKVTRQPLTVELLDGKNFEVGNNELSVTYGGKKAQLSVFVCPEDGLIEAVSGRYEIKGSLGGSLAFDLSNPDGFDFGGLEIAGEFNLKDNGVTYSGYYGQTPVNERFVTGFDDKTAGIRKCALVNGNISSAPTVIANLDIIGYSTVSTERRVFVSEIAVLRGGEVLWTTSVDPAHPFIDVNDVRDKIDGSGPDLRTMFKFKEGDFTIYSGGGDRIQSVANISDFPVDGYTVSGDTEVGNITSTGERLIRIANYVKEIIVPYTVYDSDYTNIRICRIHGDNVANYELTDNVTLDDIKKDLLKRSLYVEYFSPVNGSYVDIIPVTADMIDFSRVDVNSYDHQYGTIRFQKASVAVNIVKPYTLTGAKVIKTLTNTQGFNFILSKATVDDLANCVGDRCREIALYDNGVAVLKHTANGIGDVMIGYKLEGGKLTLLRHGIAVAFLNVSGNTFNVIDLDSATSGMSSKTYVFTHTYSSAGNKLGWTATFTAYEGKTDYNLIYYTKVHITGWASSLNSEGNSYQIAGVEYVATWSFGWNNNKKAFVLRLADRDIWFDIGTADDADEYRLTLVDTESL